MEIEIEHEPAVIKHVVLRLTKEEFHDLQVLAASDPEVLRKAVASSTHPIKLPSSTLRTYDVYGLLNRIREITPFIRGSKAKVMADRAKCPVTHCPKCGDSTFEGPRYGRLSETDALQWTCATCRYGITSPCLDWQQKVSARRPSAAAPVQVDPVTNASTS